MTRSFSLSGIVRCFLSKCWAKTKIYVVMVTSNEVTFTVSVIVGYWYASTPFTVTVSPFCVYLDIGREDLVNKVVVNRVIVNKVIVH